VSSSYLRGLARRRAVPLVALAALTGGVLISTGGGSPVGAAPKSSHAKPISAKTKGAKSDSHATPLSVAQKKSPAGSRPEGTAALPTKGPVAVFLELNTAASADSYRTSLGRGKAAAKAAARTQSGRVTAMQNSLAASVARVAPRSRVIYRMHNIMAGLAVQTDAKNVPALQGISGVKAVYPITPKRTSNAGAMPLVGAPAGWTTGDLGQNVTVGIIDSGIDYTHANFGGAGTPAAFAAIDRINAVPGQFPTAKVIGGRDFVGDNYNADPASVDPVFPFQPIPHPDANPIDCLYNGPDTNVGHGSHVAGTAAGLGVAANGSTYAGPYDTTTPFSTLKIGPGAAPRASLYALRVFGCAGSTNEVGTALDWAADPDQDGDFSDRLDVVNMSLGSDFGSPQDLDSVASNRLALGGTVVVAAMGNGGDLYDVGGSPGNAVRTIAASGGDDGFAVLDALRVNSPPSIDGDYGAEVSVAFPYATSPDLTGVLADIPGTFDPNNLGTNNKDGCDPLTPTQAAAVNGKIAWLEWTDGTSRRCGSVVRSANVKAAGAVGFVFADDAEVFSAGITGDPDIPGVLIVKSAADAIRPHLGESISATLGNTLRNSVRQSLPQNADKVYTASSRGTHGNGNLKPDVTGVSVQVFSTDVGTGSDGKTLSGTSMSSPMIAGTAALVRSKHPDWTPEEVKANIMNTADKDIFTGDNRTGDKYAPNRDGAGRVDIPQALDNQVLAYVVNDPGAVSVSFGPVEVTGPTTLTKTVKVVNKGLSAAAYNLSYVPATQVPGVSYSVKSVVTPTNPDQNKVALTARGFATLTVTLTVTDPTALTKTIDPTVETEQAGIPRQFLADASGRVVLDATDSARPSLRVPVYSAPRPASTMAAPGQLALPPGAFATADLALTGHGVGQGDGTEAVDSIVSGFGLAATSGQLPACAGVRTEGCISFPDERSTDIKFLGVTTDAPAIQASGGNPFEEAFVYFGVSSWGPWRTPAGFTETDLPIDLDLDGSPDVILFTTRFSADSDVFGVQLFDLNTGDLREDADGNNFWFLNTLDGSFDTDIFDSDSVALPVPLTALGITPTTRRINYGLETLSAYHNEAVDTVGLTAAGVPTLTVDSLRPAITATDGASSGVLFSDLPGLPLSVRKDTSAYKVEKAQGLLLLHHHNKTGLRAQVVRVKQPSSPRFSLSRTSIKAGTPVDAIVTIAPTAGPVATGAILVSRVPGVLLKQGTTANGSFRVRLPNLSRGKWTIYSHYIGDNNYLGAYSNSVVLTVT
jgi:subtilisin family serine protease